MPPKKQAVGRPCTIGVPRSVQVQIRLSPQERDRIRSLATKIDRPIGYWIRQAALEKADVSG